VIGWDKDGIETSEMYNLFSIKKEKFSRHSGRRCFVSAVDNSSLLISMTAHNCEVAVVTVLL
jgi:hypothetical protein